ncbi:class I adenylate-forming enzyme family protein [Hydrogenophaga pseudoflava]|uniref:class I adenylate-forming enzyme family protein n=1 Tax=Hydrogenophaga pseudoflava TaxID=47421 RepID=UPI0008259476|nr:AMP-binding protein [Hydrogenophaga pseudoflava]
MFTPDAPALPARSLPGLLHGLVQTQPDAPAIRWLDTATDTRSDWSFARLNAVADTLARCFMVLGVRPGDRVAWLGLNHPALIAALFALGRLEAVLVPLNTRLAAAEWTAVLDDCTPKLLVHDTSFNEAAGVLCDGPGRPVDLTLDHLLACAPSTLLPEAPTEALDRPALLVYTSGSTGTPKAAVHTQGNLLANMAIAAQVQGLTAEDTVLTVLPLFHVGGLCIQTLPALSVGATVLLHSRFDPTATLRAIAEERPSLTLQVPATLQALTAHPGWTATELSCLRTVWAGSSVLPPEPLKAFMARGVPVSNVYGSTETGPFSIALPPEHAATHLGSCGWPAPGVDIRLLGFDGRPAPAGQVGEIAVRAPNVVATYWPDRPALDADGFFHSGDLAQQAADGSFTVVGRAKDMIISGGENIYPAEIENLIATHPAVAECSVVGQADARWGEVAVAVVVLRDASAAAEGWDAPLRAFLDGRLARYKWPRRWVRLEALPRTALGKVQKAALKALLETPPAN